MPFLQVARLLHLSCVISQQHARLKASNHDDPARTAVSARSLQTVTVPRGSPAVARRSDKIW